MSILLGANPISVTIAGSAPGPQGPPGIGIVGLMIDGQGDLVGTLSSGGTTTPVPVPAGPPGVGIAAAAIGATGGITFTLTNGSTLPPIDLSGLFAGADLITTDDGTPLLTQGGAFVGAITGQS